jgi:hypothetical protein
MLISMAVWVQVSKKSTACKTLITHLNFEYKLKIPLWLVEDWQTGIDQETSPRWVKWSLIQQLNNYEVLVANGKWVVYTQWACSDEVAIVLWNQLDILWYKPRKAYWVLEQFSVYSMWIKLLCADIAVIQGHGEW